MNKNFEQQENKGFIIVDVVTITELETKSLPEKYVYSGATQSEGHGGAKYPATLHSVELPSSIQVGETISIPFTANWYGANFIPNYDLVSEYDLNAQYGLIAYGSGGKLSDGSYFHDDLHRYDMTYNRDVEHIPETKPVPKTIHSEPEMNIYLENHIWSGYADFLRNVIENGGNFADYLETPTFTQKFIDDFTKEYPEFRLQSSRTFSGVSDAPVQFYVYGR